MQQTQVKERGPGTGSRACCAHSLVAITKAGIFFLARSVPNVENDLSSVRCEVHGVNLGSHSGNILLLKFSRQVAFHERGLAHAAISHQHEFERWNLRATSWRGQSSIDSQWATRLAMRILRAKVPAASSTPQVADREIS